jgi:nucleotide-binding universal stress UspA family protein
MMSLEEQNCYQSEPFKEDGMGKILCATRGGEASYRTQDAAIALAKARGDALAFLYVADVQFLNKTAAPIVVDVENEVVKMGEFLLLMAHERAAAQGIEAKTVVRQGQLRRELSRAAQELGATLIVLGQPTGQTAVFDKTAIQAFAADLQAETGAEVRILESNQSA